jgi:colanic acid biosynthesis glycosyl transferase WcaI
MKLGIISQWFAPEESTLPNSLAVRSVNCGDEVIVLTAFPSYPQGVIYEGYSQESEFAEDLNGALVHRVKSFLSHDSSAANRIRTFISFSIASVIRSRVLAQNDVNYVYATPMTAAWAAWWVRVRYGVPYVLHVQDLWPESATSSGMMGKGPFVKVLNFVISLMLKPLYSGASEVVAIAPTMAKTLARRGVPEAKVSTVLNWDAGSPARSVDTRRASDASLRFVYAGNLGIMQDIETIVRAAALVQDCRNIEFHIYGSGISESTLTELVQDLGVSNITFHGRVSKSAMNDVYSSSDFQFVTLKDRPLFRMTIPSKFQASLANGVPVITTVQGDLSELCAKEGVGITALPENPESLAMAVRSAAQLSTERRWEMAENCRRLYSRKLSPEHGIASIRQILQKAAEQRKMSTL